MTHASDLAPANIRRLLEPSSLPFGAPILANIAPADFLPAVQKAIADAEAEIAAIKNNQSKPDFANTIEALEFAGAGLGRVSAVFGQIALANGNDELRAIETQIDEITTRYGNAVSMDADLFKRVKAVYDQRDNLTLNAHQRRLLEESFKGFARNGALLNDTDKAELAKINERLSVLSVGFKNNIVNSVKEWSKLITNEQELAGVPDDVKEGYRENATEAGHSQGWLIKLSPPPIEILEYGQNRALREEIARARAQIASSGAYDNRPIIAEILQLRQRRAELLGYKNYASFVLENRMAKTPETVFEFLRKNQAGYKPAHDAYLQQVRDFAKATDGLTELKPWDIGYYGRMLKESKFNIDLNDLRNYFSLDQVMEGLRIHAEKLFNINFVEQPAGKYEVFHPDIKVYEVIDAQSQKVIGLFYGDYYARPGAKKDGAWMNLFRNRGLENGVNLPATVSNTCNFKKPTATTPTLLTLDEVRTVFHELGHALHSLLAVGDYPSLNGVNVKWDFVELQSQLQENWVMQKDVLDSFARHYQTGAALPAETIAKLKELETFDAGFFGLRQTLLATLDMRYNTTPPANITSLDAFEDAVIAEVGTMPRLAGLQSTSFSHIFAGGYAAGYYSYKWAEVLDADVFEAFLAKGLYDRATGDRLRQTIYAKGGTEEPDAIFRQMMGRDPDPDALFRREGIKPSRAGGGAGKTAAGPALG